MTAESALPVVWLGVALTGPYVLRALIQGIRLLARRRWTSAWHASAKLMGVLPAAAAAGLVGAIVCFSPQKNTWDLPQFDPVQVAATLLPVVLGCHLAFAFAPADEPPLETLLAAPRPLAWVLFERAALTALPYFGLALIANGVVLLRFHDLPPGFWWHWVPPAIFFPAVAVMTTLASRQAAFGMTLTIVLWVGLAFMGDGMLVRWPHLWPLHIYLQPAQALSPGVYTLHQAWITLAGMAIFVRSAGRLRETEKMLSALHS